LETENKKQFKLKDLVIKSDWSAYIVTLAGCQKLYHDTDWTGGGGGGIGDIFAQSVIVADELEGTEEDI
jgi:hypothetical protein